MGQGRKPNLRRLQVMHQVRAEGCTLAEIARRLGVSRQAVADALKRKSVRQVQATCCRCTATVSATEGSADIQNLLCLKKCLATLARVPFGQRLLSMRIIAGLSQATLARENGVSQSLI